jgi:hypothetical protein
MIWNRRTVLAFVATGMVSLSAHAEPNELELGYQAAAAGDAEGARRHYEEAARGSDEEVARRARLELDAMAKPEPPPPPPMPPPVAKVTPADAALAEAYRAKAAGDRKTAAQAFWRAKSAGADAQLVAMELGYLAAASGDEDEAHLRFGEAEQGPDRDRGEAARRERSLLPRHLHFHADAYADAFGWNRVAGRTNGNSVVPMLRVRGAYQPFLALPLDVYVSAQATRDSASRGYDGGALPQIYADNYAILGAGLRVKLWKRLELFGQVGPAFNLLDDGRDRRALDARGGALTYMETAGCAPAPESRARGGFWPCLEGYAEGIYVSRFRNNVTAFARPRAAAGYLLTGPVLWQAALEARASKDLNNDYWNNFADGGIGHRWRLLAPFRVDLLLTANAGSYFGLQGRDPAPSRLSYVDARGLATTYVEF